MRTTTIERSKVHKLSRDERIALIHAVVLEACGSDQLVRTKAVRQIIAEVLGYTSQGLGYEYLDQLVQLGLAERMHRGVKMLDVETPVRSAIRDSDH